MTTPNRNEIRTRANQMFNEHNQHLPTITPTDNELRENGLWFEARNDLMRDSEKHEALGYLEQQALELGYRVIPESEFNGTETETYHGLKFDLEEIEKSNVLISGTNSTGKSRLAMGISSMLHKLGWKIITFDNSGIWKDKSDIPYYYTVKPQEWFYQLPTINKSIIYDISDLLPQQQKDLVDSYLMNYWNNRTNESYLWSLIVLEEFQLFGRSVRGWTAQNIFRIMHTGRNKQIRVLAICTDLSLVDTSLIRLCGQRFHGKLGIEENSRRKYRNYYGKKWLQITEKLNIGEFVYLNKNRLQKLKIPCFQSAHKPQNIETLSVNSSQEKGLIAKILEWIK